MARQKKITKRRRELFLAELKEYGSVVKAAIRGEIVRSGWYRLRGKDKEFAELWDEAEMAFVDRVEEEVLKRAMHGGTELRVYKTGEIGNQKVAKTISITKKSDRLIELILTNRHPNYKKAAQPDEDNKPPSDPDRKEYSKLTDDELLTMTRLQRKAHAAAEPAKSA